MTAFGFRNRSSLLRTVFCRPSDPCGIAVASDGVISITNDDLLTKLDDEGQNRHYGGAAEAGPRAQLPDLAAADDDG